jgi:hypothetical protein
MESSLSVRSWVTIGKTWSVFETIETRSELGAAEQISLNGGLSVLGKAVFQDDIVVTKKVNLGSDLSVLTAIYVGSSFIAVLRDSLASDQFFLASSQGRISRDLSVPDTRFSPSW